MRGFWSMAGSGRRRGAVLASAAVFLCSALAVVVNPGLVRALDQPSSGYTWGHYGGGRFTGLPPATAPTLVSLPGGVLVRQIASTSSSQTLILGSDGKAYQMGPGVESIQGTPTPIPVAMPTGVTFSQIDAEQSGMVGLGVDGVQYGWMPGQPNYGEVGDGTTVQRDTPTAAVMPTGVRFTKLAAGYRYTLALAEDGTAYATGQNPNGEVGDGTTSNRVVPTPVVMPTGVTFTDISAGNFSLAVGSDSKVYFWGAGGPLGVPGRLVPTQVVTPAGVRFVKVSGGYNHVLALTDTGEIYSWGNDQFGQLGAGPNWVFAVRPTPAKVAIPAGVTIRQVVGGRSSSLALGTNGRVYSWGANGSGQLGRLPLDQGAHPFPEEIPGLFFAVSIGASIGSFPVSNAVTVPFPPPVVTVPANQVLEATGPGGAAYSYEASAVDGFGVALPVTCSPAIFPLGGPTTVTCTSAADILGRTNSASFEVTVQDTTPPDVEVPPDFMVPATGPGRVVVTFAATATDTVDSDVIVACDPASGDTFALGDPTTVTCAATDDSGNMATASFRIDVVDTVAPALTTPAPITVEATGQDGATVTYGPVNANDAVDGQITPNCSPSSGSVFNLGPAKTVNCTATDSAGNIGTGSFTVTVVDTTGPTLTVPGPITVDASSAAGALVTYTATAIDTVDGPVTPTCLPASGATFLVGTTTVTCNADDSRLNAAGPASFTVTVRQQTAVLTLGGFYQPVDTGGVINTVKGGSTVPLKFEVFSGPTEITSTSVVQSFQVTQISCSTQAEDAIEEFTTTGGTELRYDTTTGQFIQNWKTPRIPGTCYRVTLTITGGATRTALFKLK